MAKNKIALGFTTYKDIRDSKYGLEVYRALDSVSDRLTPNKFKSAGVKPLIENEKEFSKYWYYENSYETRENRNKNSKILDKGIIPMGGEWVKTGSMAGKGCLGLRIWKDETLHSYTVSLEYNYSPKIDWFELFSKLVAIIQPSYGMMHLFTEEERLGDLYKLPNFRNPVIREETFTSFITATGAIRSPDSFRIEERRKYIHLPQLSWANYLGPEFEGQYKMDKTQELAFFSKEIDNSLLFTVSENIRDIEKNYGEFCNKRDLIKSTFTKDFFWF
jgi:hypothetical protein